MTQLTTLPELKASSIILGIGLFCFLFAVIILIFLIIALIGKRNVRKPKKLSYTELLYRIEFAVINHHSAKSLRAMIDEFKQDPDASQRDVKILEDRFTYRFVEFLPDAKVKYPDPKIYSNIDEFDAEFMMKL